MGKVLRMPVRVTKMKFNSIYGKRAGHRCKKCGNIFNDGTSYKNCIPCRIANAVRQMAWRSNQIDKKLCVHCVKSAYYNRSTKSRQIRCNYHRDYHNQINYNRRWSKKNYNLSFRKTHHGIHGY